jgi:chemotaxis protein methyltransferase CheR
VKGIRPTSKNAPWAPQYRHVVFADSLMARRRAVANPSASGQGAHSAATSTRADLSDDEEHFLAWLFTEAGLRLEHYRLRTLKRRIPACLRILRAASFSEARRTLQHKPSLIPRALSTLVIGVTSFFRDAATFHALRRDVLPNLIAGRYGLGIWCVGCSDGAELYSVAIQLAELGVLSRCHLLGTDCRSDAIKRAKAGVFDGALMRGVPEELRRRYFTRHDAKWTISEEIQRATHWRKADILALHEPGVWDMILCRNLSIYLSPEASSGLWPRLEASLRPSGVLVTGKAERPVGTPQLKLLAPCIWRRSRG